MTITKDNATTKSEIANLISDNRKLPIHAFTALVEEMLEKYVASQDLHIAAAIGAQVGRVASERTDELDAVKAVVRGAVNRMRETLDIVEHTVGNNFIP